MNRSSNPPGAQEADAPAIACTLSGDDQVDRVQQWGALVARSTSRAPIDHGIRVRFPADSSLVGALAELAVLEQRCCAFFSFTLIVSDGDGVTLDVRAPDDAMDAVNRLFRSR